MQKMMKQPLILFALPLLLYACSGLGASTGLTEEQEAAIPDGATTVHVQSEKPPEELYDEIRSAVLEAGYEMADENESLRRFVTADHNVGRRMRMHLIVNVRPSGRESELNLTGKWAFEQTSNAMESTLGGTQRVQEATRDAAWGSNSASRYAFSRLVLLADNLSGADVTYQ